MTKTQYIANDIKLDESRTGLILYGVNMSGKSSLLRSIGVAIVMAQAGLYVSADSFQFRPFTRIMSKITVKDNPFKNQSLFMVEMEEVNNMLRRSDTKTLVLSDELCSSTETSSAHSIVSETLATLSAMKVNFVFSTHLHELQNIPKICNDLNIAVMHFKVHVDPETKKMIFDRKLQEGGIEDTYGLEIAESLGLPKTFIKGAFETRNHIRSDNRIIGGIIGLIALPLIIIPAALALIVPLAIVGLAVGGIVLLVK